jgi:hypothetical protein
MRRFTLSALSAVALSLVISVTNLEAQNGPNGPSSGTSNGPNGPSGPSSAPAGQMTPESLATYLRGLSGMTVADPVSLSNGGARIIAKQQKDGWTYEVEIEFTSSRKSYWLLAKLRPAAGYTQAQLLQMLKTGWQIDPVHFVINGDHMYLCDGTWSTKDSPEQLMSNFNNFTKAIRDSYSAWSPTP